tara:strand:- start:714 stop:818 length:105 start_codon:yes stop_codon:yes gene_type:complete
MPSYTPKDKSLASRCRAEEGKVSSEEKPGHFIVE